MAHKALISFMKSRNIVAKTKKSYRQSCMDLVEVRAELEKMKTEIGAKSKEIEKLEGKIKKALTQMESTG